MRLSLRNSVAIIVLLAWGGSIAWLAVRRGGQSNSAFIQSEASLRLGPGDAWFQVMAGDVPIGIAGITLDTVESGYRIHQTVTLLLPRNRTLYRANRTTDYTLAPDLSLIRAESRDGIHGFRRLFGLEATPDSWSLTVKHDDRVVTTARLTGDLPTGVLLPPYRLAVTGALAAADPRSFNTFSGWPPAAEQVEYLASGDTMVVFADSSVTTDSAGGWRPVHFDSAASRRLLIDATSGPLVLLVDHRGTLTGLSYPLGLRWIRTDFPLARREIRPGTEEQLAATLLAQLPVIRPWSGSRIADLPPLDSARYRVIRRDGSRIGDRLLRLFVGDGIRLESERVTGGSPIDLLLIGPTSRRGPGKGEQTVDPLIQADNAKIVAFADSFRTDSGGTRFDELRARFRRISVEKDGTGPVDALGTLEAGRGAPDGRARLLAAVLKANGDRARFVIGVAELADTIYSHAWVEVWSPSAGRWDAIDPLTLAPASARLIRLARAGSSHPEEILAMVADVRFVLVDPPPPTRSQGTLP